mmetsp:Transcript_30744/g.92189  ORF Transcript_30744/g.92189 Transcript_30744/m.92189 type:complete len:105 (-) Transcript_30744:1901-2215(-)
MRWATLRGYDVDPADLPPDSSSTGSARSALNVRRGVVVPARSPWRERAAARDPATRRRARDRSARVDQCAERAAQPSWRSARRRRRAADKTEAAISTPAQKKEK